MKQHTTIDKTLDIFSTNTYLSREVSTVVHVWRGLFDKRGKGRGTQSPLCQCSRLLLVQLLRYLPQIYSCEVRLCRK